MSRRDRDHGRAIEQATFAAGAREVFLASMRRGAREQGPADTCWLQGKPLSSLFARFTLDHLMDGVHVTQTLDVKPFSLRRLEEEHSRRKLERRLDLSFMGGVSEKIEDTTVENPASLHTHLHHGAVMARHILQRSLLQRRVADSVLQPPLALSPNFGPAIEFTGKVQEYIDSTGFITPGEGRFRHEIGSRPNIDMRNMQLNGDEPIEFLEEYLRVMRLAIYQCSEIKSNMLLSRALFGLDMEQLDHEVTELEAAIQRAEQILQKPRKIA